MCCSQLITSKSVCYPNATHPSDHFHLCSVMCHLIFFVYRPGLTSMQHAASHTTAVQPSSHNHWHILIGKQLSEFIAFNSNSGLRSCISISIHSQHVTQVAKLQPIATRLIYLINSRQRMADTNTEIVTPVPCGGTADASNDKAASTFERVSSTDDVVSACVRWFSELNCTSENAAIRHQLCLGKTNFDHNFGISVLRYFRKHFTLRLFI